jgi:DNA-binding CsgD family transcriptional regulator
MELIERTGFLASLQTEFLKVTEGEGHCILLAGEAGIGKTSLTRAFCKTHKNDCNIYQGTCDALFTPRPLAPLHDIAWQIRTDLWQDSEDIADRVSLFSRIFNELRNQEKPTIIIFEDIHWADEATLDFIKFFARRITQIPCLFILTYRNDEIHVHHPLRNVLGQLSPDSFTNFMLPPLSRHAVEKLAREKGYNGEDVYSISGGNPFYVNEILASYSPGIPDNIKDAVLSVFNRLDEQTKQVWEILSVIPSGFEIKYLEKMQPAYSTAVENCLASKILIPENGLIFFKHELYRRTIEVSLSPLLRVALNKRILDLFLDSFEQNLETERIIHHAKNANENELVVRFAPLAAKQSAAVGAHQQASKLYLSAIEYYKGDDNNVLVSLYEAYAYECYLTSQVKEAIVYQEKALRIWTAECNDEQAGNCLRFLSRLWWFDGNRKLAEDYGYQAIEVLKDQASSKSKAMAFSNMSQLKMLSDRHADCIFWGEKAIAMARDLGDDEILSHALNNVGTVHMRIPHSKQEGTALLTQSLEIALRKSYHEHAARAYTNLGSNGIELKDFTDAENILDAGIQYCEERDLDSWTAYMFSCKSRLLLEKGDWDKAYAIACQLIQKENQPSIVRMGALTIVAKIKMRRGEEDAAPLLLEANTKAFEAMELQRILPVLAGLLEYEWITGKCLVENEMLMCAINMLQQTDGEYNGNEFVFWVLRARQRFSFEGFSGEHKEYLKNMWLKNERFKTSGSSYEQAIRLFEGNPANKKQGIMMVHHLGASAVYDKMKLEMRSSGIKGIPRGMRKTTQSNPAYLTDRELEVLYLLKESMQNKEIASRLFISVKTVDHHISAILLKLNTKSRTKAVNEALRLRIIK